ncbi:MAG: DUF934 domain-containing protein [Pseudomonadota bacterium]
MLIDATGEIADGWAEIADDADIPWHGPIIVPFARLDEALTRRPSTGVALPNDTEIDAVVPYLPRLGLVAVDFPSFADGRGFSIGQALRDRRFEGRLRAVGPVIADQFAYLLACGFDEVKVPEHVALRQPVEQWMAQLSKVTLGYQRGRPVRGSILDQRHGGTA